MLEFSKKFGFGCMRLPLNGEEIDRNKFSQMVDTFLENGFQYFDTARPYHGGNSEKAIKECLTSRYKREDFILTNKLSGNFFQKEGGVRPLFENQLKTCGVDYFDFYLMHAQNKDFFAKFKRCNAYETAFRFKEEGKVKHVGLSFHDTPELLDQILTEYPDIEVVQLQFNYLDYLDPAVQSKKCYDVCCKHNKPVIVMEPVRGGKLVGLQGKAKEECDKLGINPAELAIRFAASFDNVKMVLSGMSNIDQMNQNISFMKDFVPINQDQKDSCQKIADAIHEQNLIPCTSCHYCTSGCPQKIAIPELFACYNKKKLFSDWNADWYYSFVYTVKNGKASSCKKCGLCENICPQHLPIRTLLEQVATQFENGQKVK